MIYSAYNYLFSILVSSPPLRHFIKHLGRSGRLVQGGDASLVVVVPQLTGGARAEPQGLPRPLHD